MKRPSAIVAVLLFACTLVFLSCRERDEISESSPVKVHETQPAPPVVDISSDYDTSLWGEITLANSLIELDIRYATTDNFTEKQIYDCGRCFLRPELARKLIVLNKYLAAEKGLRFKVWDCYRPRPAQQKLWDIVPNPIYVTPPEKGSMHNRGLAVDLTLVDESGEELDMGTAYDFFGRRAHTDNFDLPEEVLANRKLLQDLMIELGFKTIQSEWWHFSYQEISYPLDDWEWACGE